MKKPRQSRGFPYDSTPSLSSRGAKRRGICFSGTVDGPGFWDANAANLSESNRTVQGFQRLLDGFALIRVIGVARTLQACMATSSLSSRGAQAKKICFHVGKADPSLRSG